ncbi:MAG TPA: SUMF1/EgtB/PvdO family nonheme iron enzyme [Candidatus Acidoferrales bacterium]|jgi:gamma-glutamyl hercynylcysteine S-oxide synthase|nr:SUMF1/EgtB/PvdO family nonheme iron enzyme [Candidatus Acidoferrales bacterium]
MTASRAAIALQPSLLSRLEEARARTDSLFNLLPPNSFYDRPVPERHRLIFYLGHLEAFDQNLLSGPLGSEPHDATLDKLFAFGIDPVGGGLPTDVASDWPNIANVEKYKRSVRERLDARLRDRSALKSSDPALLDGTLLHAAIEHRLMHAETLAYLLHSLPLERKTPQPWPSADPRPAPQQRQVMITSGTATLGQQRNSVESFGWDNEFETQEIFVPSFSIDAFPVTNGQYLEFVRANGYEDSRYWTAEDWDWKNRQKLEHPHFWLARSNSPASDGDTEWEYRAMFGTIPLPKSWPVYVSYAEASAFARWAQKKLPTEPQWHRAAYGTLEGGERQYPWGDAAPESHHGNFSHQRWDPCPVDAHSAGASAFGVLDLLGNGWEWTETPFGPLNGFKPFPFYRGYSADFFDGKHFVMKGGSARTDACMLRRSFRNWFQPHYPYAYATFRCVEE